MKSLFVIYQHALEYTLNVLSFISHFLFYSFIHAVSYIINTHLVYDFDDGLCKTKVSNFS